MAVIVTCPNCEKKLKMNDPTPGKKVRCPGCKEPFVPSLGQKSPSAAAPAAKPKPKRKPQKPVKDEYDDYGSGGDDLYGDDGFNDDDYQDEPVKPRRSAGSAGAKKPAGKQKSKAAASKKKGAAGGKSKTPLFVGVGVLALALAGGLTWMLLPSDEDNDAASAGGGEVVNNDMASHPADPTPAEVSGSGNAETSSNAMSGMGSNDAPQNVAAQASATGTSTATTTSTSGSVDVSLLPENSELVVRIDTERLLGGPLGQLLTMPPISGKIAEFQQMSGFGPTDIQSITVGVGGICEAIARDAEPKPDELPGVAVIRTKVSIDSAKLQSLMPFAQPVTEGSVTYLRIQNKKPVGIWVADSNTVVVGIESWVKQVAASSSSATNIDGALFDGKSAIQAVFTPSQPDLIFRAVNQNKLQGPPASVELMKTFLANAKSAAFGFDFTNDLGVSMAARCTDSAGAQKLVAALKASSAENKAMQDSQQAPAMFAPLMNIQKAMEESMEIEANGDVCRLSSSAVGGGQQIGAFLPMLPALLGPAIEQAQAAAGRTQAKNNLKQIAMAMHNFNSVYSRFPNAASVDSSGQKLLSWRVHVLSFLGHEELYKKFALDEPWDSPTNKVLIAQMPDVYRSPEISLEPGKTVLQVPVGPGTAFENGKGNPLREFADGTSNTFLILEVSPDRAVTWTQPEDFTFNPSNPKDGLGGVQPNGFQAAFADGSIIFVPTTADNDTIKAIFTRNGGEIVSRNF